MALYAVRCLARFETTVAYCKYVFNIASCFFPAVICLFFLRGRFDQFPGMFFSEQRCILTLLLPVVTCASRPGG